MKTLLHLSLLMIPLQAATQTTWLEWDPVIDVNPTGTGTLRPRIALNAAGDPVVIWGDNSPMTNLVAVGNGASFNAPVEVTGPAWMPSVADWMGSSIAAKGDTVWVVIKAMPEDSWPIYVRRSIDGGSTWSDTVRVDPYDGLVSRFPSIALDDDGDPLVQYMQFDSGYFGARQVVVKWNGTGFDAPVQVSTPFSSGDVCDCCPNQIVHGAGGVAALYRNAESNVRTIWGAASVDAGITFPIGEELDQSGWVLGACPSSGPDGLIDDGQLFFTWMSGASNGTKVYVGSASASDLGLGPQTPVHGGQPTALQQNFPRIAGNADTLGVVWQQSSGGQHEILFSYSTTGLTGLGEPDTVNTSLPGLQRTPDIEYRDGSFHLIWSDAASNTVRYRKARIASDVGVNGIAAPQWAPWPSPAQDRLWIGTVPPWFRSFMLVDGSGHTVAHVPGSTTSIDLSPFAPGPYRLVALDEAGGTISQHPVLIAR